MDTVNCTVERITYHNDKNGYSVIKVKIKEYNNLVSVYAKKIVNMFKENTLEIIDNEPDRLIEVDGIGKKRVETIKKAWKEQKEILKLIS